MQYDATNKLPSDSGALVFSDGTTDTATAGGGAYGTAGATTLDINTLGSDTTCFYSIAVDAGNMDLNSTTGYTVEWRLKMIDAESDTWAMASLYCEPQVGEMWIIYLTKDSGKFEARLQSGGTDVVLDADANNPEFHSLRVTVSDGNATLYIDGNSVATETLSTFGVAVPLRLGDVTGTNDAHFITDYLYAYDGGAIGPKEFREPQKKRTRRIICDIDSDVTTYYADGPTEEGFLSQRLAHVPGTQIDTVVYNAGGVGMAMTYNTSVTEVLSFRESDGILDYSNNMAQYYINQGKDDLEMTVDYCKDNDIEIFWSMRMNDIHDAWYPGFFPQIKKDNPDWLVGDEVNEPDYGEWTAYNYSVPNVRQMVYDLCEEVCQNYDIDGIVLEFTRFHLFFKSQADYGDANSTETQMMTDLVTDIRVMADREGFLRGRPILIAARTLDSNSICQAIGLDIDNWMANDLIDIWVGPGDVRLKEWSDNVALANSYDVPFYPCIKDAIMMSDDTAKYASNSYNSYKGQAANVWAAEPNGIYTFNIYTADAIDSLMSVIGSSATLANEDKMYSTDSLGWNYGFETWIKDAKTYVDRNLWVGPERTLDVSSTVNQTVKLHVGEDCATTQPSLTLRTRLTYGELGDTGDLTVKLEGNTLTGNRRIYLNSTTGYTVEWRVKMLDADSTSEGSAMIYCSPGVDEWWHVSVLKHDGKIWADLNYGTDIELDSDADNPDFHTLRVTVSGGNASLYIDSNSTAAATASLKAGGPLPLRFGDLTNTADATYLIDYIYAYDGGAVAGDTDPNWTMRYEVINMPDVYRSTNYLDGTTGTWKGGGLYSDTDVCYIVSGVGSLKIDTATDNQNSTCYFDITHDWINYTVNPNDVNEGWNSIEFDLAAGKSTVTLEDILLDVDH